MSNKARFNTVNLRHRPLWGHTSVFQPLKKLPSISSVRILSLKLNLSSGFFNILCSLKSVSTMLFPSWMKMKDLNWAYWYNCLILGAYDIEHFIGEFIDHCMSLFVNGVCCCLTLLYSIVCSWITEIKLRLYILQLNTMSKS